MEFKFRAVDDRPSTRSPIFDTFSGNPLLSPTPVKSFPSMSSFSNAPFGFPIRGSGDHELIRSPMLNSSAYIVRDVAMHDHERERCREEIILDEIARRREIELEARREIVFLEQEMAARRARLSFINDNRFSTMAGIHRQLLTPGRVSDNGLKPMQWSSFPRSMAPHSLLDEFYGLSSHPTVLESAPLTLLPRDVAGEVKTSSSDHDKDKVIMLAKPNPNVTRTKRKADEPPPTLAANVAHPFGLKKKPKDEWSCALCQVSAPSEVGLKEHLLGKKHKAKEERLKKKKLAKSHNIEAIHKTKRNGSPSKTSAKLEGKSLDENKTGDASTDFKSELVPEKVETSGDLKNMAGSAMMQQVNGAQVLKKNKFTFWCQMCQVGSVTVQVMEDHKNGKKHRANLQKLDKSNEAMKPNHISAETFDPNLVMRSETSAIALENKVPKLEIPNLMISEPDVTHVLSKSVIAPKPEERDVAYKSDKTEASASENSHFSLAIVSKLETQDIDDRATVETTTKNDENID